MSKVVLYIAQSLDGFIARPDGQLDWLTSVPYPEDGGDYGYSALLSSIGTTIMGRKTYEEILNLQPDWSYPGLDSYIVSRNPNLAIQSPDTYLLKEDLKTFVTGLKQKAEKDIWLIGGGQLITEFINLDLLDKMIITIIPKIIGEGIPLFAPKPAESNWKLIECQAFDTGLVNLTYERTL